MSTAVIRAWLVALMVLALSGLPTRIFAACKIGRLAELPVTMTGLRPLVSPQRTLLGKGVMGTGAPPSSQGRIPRLSLTAAGSCGCGWAISTSRSLTTTRH